jgi:hypothetical protein
MGLFCLKVILFRVVKCEVWYIDVSKGLVSSVSRVEWLFGCGLFQTGVIVSERRAMIVRLNGEQ